MLSAKTQSEVYVYGLIHGLVKASEVIGWSDQLLAESTNPEEWLLELCTGERKSEKELISLLHSVPGVCDARAANTAIIDLRSKDSRPFGLFPPEVIPTSFSYPAKFVEFAKGGGFLCNPSVEFVDAHWDYARSLLQHVKDVNGSYVLFAKVDDRFCCFDSSSNNQVVIVDIVERSSTPLTDFDTWLRGYDEEAKSEWWYVGA